MRKSSDHKDNSNEASAPVKAARRTSAKTAEKPASQKTAKASAKVSAKAPAKTASQTKKKAKTSSGEYGNDSISSLKGADRVRLRPGVIFGSDDMEGAAHGFFEILSNSTDEAKAGYGSRIEVTRFADGSIQVKDFGRGVPMDYNENEGRYNWDLIYCELYAGGKYDADNYLYSLGLNGLGACATQYASEWFDASSVRDGFRYSVHFEKGSNIGGLSKEPVSAKTPTGTTQRWKPDREVFTDVDIPLDYFRQTMKRQAIINKGITYVLDDEASGEHEEYYYEDGILGYIREVSGESAFTVPFSFQAEGAGRDRADRPEYNVKAEVAFCFSNTVNLLEYYHNSSWLEHGGSPEKAVRSAFVSAFDKEFKNRGKYNRNESKITFGDIEDCLVLVVNSFSTQTSYENQTKKAINNKFIQDFLTEQIRKELELWFIENKADGDRTLDQVLVNKRSREASESSRITVKKKLMGNIDITNKVQKYVDCRSKDPKERELFICEGDSALGSLKVARDASYQALMPIRGKILNLEKASLQQTFDSDIIMDLIRVLGCGVEVRGKKMPKDIPDFNLDNLRFSKIISATDQDVDGFHIRCLLFTMIHKLCPQLIENGYVYVAETPLYEITIKQGKKSVTKFAFSDAERDKIIEGIDPKHIRLQRSKGLGENDAETMAIFMKPESRRLTRVTAEDAEKMQETLQLFMGDEIAPRKAYIEANGHLYMDNLDLS